MRGVRDRPIVTRQKSVHTVTVVVVSVAGGG